MIPMRFFAETWKVCDSHVSEYHINFSCRYLTSNIMKSKLQKKFADLKSPNRDKVNQLTQNPTDKVWNHWLLILDKTAFFFHSKRRWSKRVREKDKSCLTTSAWRRHPCWMCIKKCSSLSWNERSQRSWFLIAQMFSFFKKKSTSYIAQIEPGGIEVKVQSGKNLLTAALEAGINWPYKCRVGSCGTCKCKILEGKKRFKCCA